MNNIQLHRGPDESGMYIDAGIGLGHRRLSIIDISSGQQPLHNEDGSVITVFNGEIYNYRELRTDLKKRGHVFKTDSDTEVIVHAWEEWKELCVNKFRGMFAFAIWDRNEKTLFLARDRLGLKPIHYSILPDGHFVFGSELKSVISNPFINKNLSILAIEDYFSFGYIPDPRTIYEDIFKLPAGHYLKITKNKKKISPVKYWDVPFNIDSSKNENDAKDELVGLFKEAIDIRLISEVPLGAFLSGGIDSSSVVAIMSELMKDPVKTCSISFNEKLYDESDYADIVARLFETNHSCETVDSDEFFNLGDLIKIYDEPFADDSALATMRLCKLAKKSVTVALSGDGGDEIFSGYRSYANHLRKDRVRKIIPEYIRLNILKPISYYYPKMDWAPKVIRAKSTLETLALNPIESYAYSAMISTNLDRQLLFSNELKKELEGYNSIQVVNSIANNCTTDDALGLVQYLDLKLYLPSNILTKVDRASMANSLEVRVPLLDHKLVEWASSLPASMKIKSGNQKYILKEAMKGRVPDEILNRKKKGFDVPVGDWIRKEMKVDLRKLVSQSFVVESGYFNNDNLKMMAEHHISGRRNYGALLWALFVFEEFLKNAVA